jgi:hypothetical protein
MGLNAERHAERTAVEWFADATRWYVEGHQGCACCHQQHCVFRSEWGRRIEYYCTACDFSTCHDGQSGRYFATPGEPSGAGPAVLLDSEELWVLRTVEAVREGR